MWYRIYFTLMWGDYIITRVFLTIAKTFRLKNLEAKCVKDIHDFVAIMFFTDYLRVDKKGT